MNGTATFQGIDGFLPGRASFMLDVVFLAMFLVVPLLAWSIYQAKFRRRYTLHKRMQLGMGLVLLVAVALFELDAQYFSPWELRAKQSPYYSSDIWSSTVHHVLWFHLMFAVTTPLLWIYVTVTALRRFPNPPRPAEHSASHRFWGWLAAWDMVGTGVTGWVFYWLAFVA
jgi:hypothetical protein